MDMAADRMGSGFSASSAMSMLSIWSALKISPKCPYLSLEVRQQKADSMVGNGLTRFGRLGIPSRCRGCGEAPERPQALGMKKVILLEG
jgi:hypothetical protein